MYTTIVAVVGILLLVAIAIGVGASMDTEAQRAAGRAAAHERRRRNEEMDAHRAAHRRLRDEWVRLTEERQHQRGVPLNNGRLANGPAGLDRNRVVMHMLAYAGVVATVVPLTAWLMLGASGWL
jgi:Flp pilus assembly protein TadB